MQNRTLFCIMRHSAALFIKFCSIIVSGVGNWFGDIGDALTSDDPHQEGALSAAKHLKPRVGR